MCEDMFNPTTKTRGGIELTMDVIVSFPRISFKSWVVLRRHSQQGVVMIVLVQM